MSAFTEEEAKTKWCPMARVSFRAQTVCNRVYEEIQIGVHTKSQSSAVAGSLCIGSACMAWRWHGWLYGEGNGNQLSGTRVAGDIEAYRKKGSSQTGYCSAFGEP